MDRQFLRLQPPANYTPGAGRGAVGFNNPRKPEFPRLPQPEPRPLSSAVSVQTVYEEAERKKYLRKRHSVQIERSERSESSNKRAHASFADWASMPPAVDTLRTYHRINAESQRTQRTYALPASASAETQIERLEAELRADNKSPSVYIQLAALLSPSKAKQVLVQGIFLCPPNEQLYLSLAKLLPAAERRSTLARGLKAVKTSEKLWIEAAQCEPTTEMQLQCVHMGLLQCPKSEQLWRFAVELEPRVQQDVLLMARQFVPTFQPTAPTAPTATAPAPPATAPAPTAPAPTDEIMTDTPNTPSLSPSTVTLLSQSQTDPIRALAHVKSLPEPEQILFIKKLAGFLSSPLRKRALYSQAVALVPNPELYDDWIQLEQSLKNPYAHLENRRNALTRE